MNKHTPGPWSVKPNSGSYSIHSENQSLYGADPYLATVDGIQRSANFANARLIASAPELLEALKQFYKTFALHNCPENIDPALFYATMEKAQLTIAKAEGT